MSTDTPIRPTFHHVNLKTTRLQELVDWYTTVVGAEVTFQDASGAWLTNDAANHRIALLCFPGFVDDPDRETRTGMHHSAFEYDSFTDLNASYLRLRDAGIEPDICIDRGRRDPAGGHGRRLACAHARRGLARPRGGGAARAHGRAHPRRKLVLCRAAS